MCYVSFFITQYGRTDIGNKGSFVKEGKVAGPRKSDDSEENIEGFDTLHDTEMSEAPTQEVITIQSDTDIVEAAATALPKPKSKSKKPSGNDKRDDIITKVQIEISIKVYIYITYKLRGS